MSAELIAPKTPVEKPTPSRSSFPLNLWYVAGLSSELKDQPIARTLLNEPVVLYRDTDGEVGALEDRCCHRALPLSKGTIDKGGLRCGYHGLLFDKRGQCIEIPGQDIISDSARVAAYKEKSKTR